MKKFSLDKKYFVISLYALAVIALGALLIRVINNIESIAAGALSLLTSIGTVLAAFVYGFFIAFILNIPTNFIQKKFNMRRLPAVAVVYALAISAAIFLTAVVFPDIASGFRALIDMTLSAVLTLYNDGPDLSLPNEILGGINQIFGADMTLRHVLDQSLPPLMALLTELPAAMAANLLNAMQGILNLALGVIIAFYMLCQKNTIFDGITKILAAFMPPARLSALSALGARSAHTLERYIVSRLLDSILIGAMFFLTASILRLPFPLILALIFAITNIIPYFGPIVGSIIIILIVLIQNPVLGLWTAVTCLLLQQFDANILGPKLVGDAIGLKPLGIIASILIGGALFGLPGIFFAPPIAAVGRGVFMGYIEERSKD